MTDVYSMRKIPIMKKDSQEVLVESDIDKVKILELSNFIDEWEKELLFSETGFFSLKGRSVENKTKEFIEELDQLISTKIYEINFSKQESKNIIIEIKKRKLDAIKSQMIAYEKNEMKNWEFEVYENSIKSCIQRAVLYKNNPEIIDSSFKNGISIIETMAEKEKWSDKTLTVRRNIFEADFFFEIINSFILARDAKASFYFEKYKEKLAAKDKITLDEAIKTLKNNVIAYNWAKELFSYEMSAENNEKEIKEIKDKELQFFVRKYLSEFLQKKKKEEKTKEQEKNEKNWKEIISILEKEPDKAELYIDYTLSKESINSKKNYIKMIRKDGYTTTNRTSFLNLIKMMFDDYEKFKQEDISNYRKDLSVEDYNLIEKMRSFSATEYTFLNSDYSYIQSRLSAKQIDGKEDLYKLIKLVIAAKDNYVSIKKEEPDIEKRNKIIDEVLARYNDKK